MALEKVANGVLKKSKSTVYPLFCGPEVFLLAFAMIRLLLEFFCENSCLEKNFPEIFHKFSLTL